MVKNFLVPPSEVYKKGPYLHSNAQQFLNNNLNFSEMQDQEYLDKLYEHLRIAEQVEREFYTDLGVKDANDFSDQFLYGFDGQNQGNIEKTIQKILISASSSYALIANPNRKSVEDTLAEAAEELISGLSTTDKKAFDAIVNAGMDAAVDRVQQLMDYLNANQGRSKKAFKLKKGQKIAVSFPKGQLSSKTSKYIIDLLIQINPKIKELLRADANRKIEKYGEFFKYSAKQEGLDDDTTQVYWNRVEKKLRQLLKNDDSEDSGNMAAFFNPLGAEGALGEIAMILSFEDILTDKGTVQQLANDLVKAERLEYNTSEGVVVKKNKYGDNIILKYKSPTDMIITVGQKVYTFQIKTSYSTLAPDKILKLQSSIQLQTLLGNLVSGGFMSDDSAKIFIYTIVNLSTKEIQEHEGADEKIALACRMLQMCLEYFAESRYAKNLSEVLDSKNLSSNTNAGNMFFIYSGRLIPISHFIKAAIASIKGKQLINILPYQNMVKYGKHYSTRFIGREHTIEGRIQLGQSVYENTKLTELGFYIGQLEQYIKEGIY